MLFSRPQSVTLIRANAIRSRGVFLHLPKDLLQTAQINPGDDVVLAVLGKGLCIIRQATWQETMQQKVLHWPGGVDELPSNLLTADQMEALVEQEGDDE